MPLYPQQKEERITVRLEGIDYYLVGGTFSDLRDAVRAIPGRRWLGPPHGEEKVWELPLPLNKAASRFEGQGFKLRPTQADENPFLGQHIQVFPYILALIQHIRFHREIFAYQVYEICSTLVSNTVSNEERMNLISLAHRYRRAIEMAECNIAEVSHSDLDYFRGVLGKRSKTPVPFEHWILFYLWDSRQRWTDRESFPHCVPISSIHFDQASFLEMRESPEDETTIFNGTLNRISNAYKIPISLLPTLRIRTAEIPITKSELPVIAFEVKPPQEGLRLDLLHFKLPCPNLFQWRNYPLGDSLIEASCSPSPFDSYLRIDRLGA